MDRPAARLGLALLTLLTACSTPRLLDAVAPGPATEVSAQPVSGTGQALEANWKERIAQPYVHLEVRGDYRDMGAVMRRLFAAASEVQLEPSGAPFALFFDDPGQVAIEELRARACLPVRARPERLGTLSFDVLPRAMVVYARVAGAYPEVPRSYPALFTYLRELGWRAGGPIREVYLVDPGSVQSYAELVPEVQIPWMAGSQEPARGL
jgi:effector-binding domain-containing protein